MTTEQVAATGRGSYPPESDIIASRKPDSDQAMVELKPRLSLLCILYALPGIALQASDMPVKISEDIGRIDVDHAGTRMHIQREQDPHTQIAPNFQRTSRRCPPFCIQPMHLPNGVETIGELEMLDYLERSADGDDTILIIDSRAPRWLRRGTIPGAINLHYKRLSLRSAESPEIARILENRFGARRTGQLWDFSDARTVVLFCNGAWCGQSPVNIRSLMRFGYPPSKIKWYRGGMQAWETLGLTTVTTESD